MGKSASEENRQNVVIILGNSGLVNQGATSDICDTEETSDDTDEETLLEELPCEHGTGGSHLSIADFSLDIQGRAVEIGLKLAMALRDLRDGVSRKVSLATLLDVPRGLDEMKVFDSSSKGLSRSRLEKGPLCTVEDLAPPVRNTFLDAVNRFNFANRGAFSIKNIRVVTATRARREIIRMVGGKEGYPSLKDIPSEELLWIYSRDSGVTRVRCPGVFAGTYWLLGGQANAQAEIYGVWEDGPRVKGGHRRKGAAFAKKRLGVSDVVDKVLSASTETYRVDNGDVTVGAENTLWTFVP